MAKTEAIVIEFSNLSLDQLVAQKKINSDQKAQIQKKPQLEAQVAQLEEQQKNLLEYSKSMKAKHEKEKTDLKEAHEAAVLQARTDATDAANMASSKQVSEALKIVAQFLHAAAYKRQSEDIEPDEAKAYEGVLFHLYQGNATSHDAITKLVNGSEEKIMDPHSSEELNYTYAQLKLATITSAEAEFETEVAVSQPVEEKEETSMRPEVSGQSDPTITNAGLTELEDTMNIPVPEVEDNVTELETVTVAPEQASVDVGNAVAEAAWGSGTPRTTEATQPSDDVIQIPRDPAETETGTAAPPATQQSTTNWADDAVAAAADSSAATPLADGDGFSEVRREHRGRGRNAGRGGRGYDGRGRGRGRGGENRGRGRGGRGGPRGGANSPAVSSSTS